MAYRQLIGGELAGGSQTLDVFNPATGAVLDTCPRADAAQPNAAVAAAKAAIAWTNDTEYDLGGSVWASDVERGFAVASRTQSGMGAENGQEGPEEYTRAKIINVAL